MQNRGIRKNARKKYECCSKTQEQKNIGIRWEVVFGMQENYTME
jgi:hypothetical protein